LILWLYQSVLMTMMQPMTQQLMMFLVIERKNDGNWRREREALGTAQPLTSRQEVASPAVDRSVN